MSFCCQSSNIRHCVMAVGCFLRAPEGLQGRALVSFASAASCPGPGTEEKCQKSVRAGQLGQACYVWRPDVFPSGAWVLCQPQG